MGDAADDAYDREMGIQEEITRYSMLDDEILVEYTAKSRLPKIISIHKYFKIHNRLSNRQRYCLAVWAYEHQFDYY